MYKLYIGKRLTTEEILKRHIFLDEIVYNEYGKPYFKNNPIFFNVSHSGDYTVLLVSDKECGIDIQKLTFKKNVINKVCTEIEKNNIKNAFDFTKIWVKKESYVKMIGQGISYGLKNVDTNKIKNIKVKKYKNYYIAICLKEGL